MTLISNYDMVLALSISEINNQIAYLCTQGIISPELNYQNQVLGADVDIKATFNPPTFEVIEGEPESLLMICTVQNGGNLSLKTYDFKEMKLVTKNYSLDNTKYVFSVKIGQLSISGDQIQEGTELITTKATTAIIDIMNKKVPEVPPSDFLIQSIFLDLENTNIASYDSNKSNFPPEITGSNLIALQNALVDYFKPKNKKYVLGYGYSITDITPTDAKYRPTSVNFSTSYSEENPETNCLNFLMMVNGNKLMGTGNVAGSLIPPNQPSNIIGALAIPYTFFNQQFIQTIIKDIGAAMSGVIHNLSQEKQINNGKSSNNNYIFGHSWGHIKTNASYTQGSLIISDSNDYQWSCDPWEIEIDSSAQNSSTSIGFGKYSSTSWVDASFKETDKFYADVAINNSGNTIEIVVSLKIEGKQSIDGKAYTQGSIFTGFKPIETDHHTGSGSLTTQNDAQIIITLSNNNGVFECTINKVEGVYQSDPVALGDIEAFKGSFSQNIDSFNNAVLSITNQLTENLKNELGNLFTNSIILPLGNVFSFESLNLFNSPSTNPGITNNAVISVVSYKKPSNVSDVREEELAEA